MSEENNENSSKITVTTSAGCVVNPESNPTDTESAIDSQMQMSQQRESGTSVLIKEESKLNSSMETTQQSGAVSIFDSTSNTMKTGSKNDSSMLTSQQSQDNSRSSEGNTQTASNSSGETGTNYSKSDSSEHTGSSYISDSSERTYSSEAFNRDEIEESVLFMIRQIEEEIEGETHNGPKQFQNIEMKIKTSRVMVAIEQMIQKLEIAFCLPYIFVENMHDMNALCGDSFVQKLMDEYCKIRDEDIDVCRFQPTVINCINDAFTVGFSQFVDLHRNKVGLVLQLRIFI